MSAQNPNSKEIELVTEDKSSISVVGEVEPKAATGWQRLMWIAIAIVSFVYIFIPEPTDAIPLLGWLDEGVAALICSFALEKIGIRIPLLQRFLGRKNKKQK